jgi:hypothetical protein
MLLEDAFECVSAQIGGGTACRRNGLAARLASIGLFRVLAPFRIVVLKRRKLFFGEMHDLASRFIVSSLKRSFSHPD